MSSRSIYSSQFWLLCTSSLLFFASFNMLIPELPAYLSSLGGEEYKGFIIGLFTITAMASRPFSGKLADRIGRVPVIMFGSIVCLVCSLIYPVLTSVWGFLFLRLVHGFSTGFTPTGQTAYLSDIIPAERRGEAVGYLGTAGTLGMACGPALGGFVATYFSVDAMFFTSSALALLSVLIVVNIRETLETKQRFNTDALKIQRKDLFEPRVIAPSLVMCLTAFSYGAAFTLIPDMGRSMGIENKGLLFTYFTVASLVIRLLAGKTSDRVGRVAVLRVSTGLVILSMIVIAMAETKLQLIIGMVLYGLAQGATSPTLLAWATDLSDPAHKGKGVASLYIFMEFGIFLGAMVTGWWAGTEIENASYAFLASAVLSLFSFVFLVKSYKDKLQQAV
ncbi:MAG: MFS transporter [Cyclobacteriaceae bacterium]